MLNTTHVGLQACNVDTQCYADGRTSDHLVRFVESFQVGVLLLAVLPELEPAASHLVQQYTPQLLSFDKSAEGTLAPPH